MKYFIYLNLLIFLSCNSKLEDSKSIDVNKEPNEYFEFYLSDYNYSLGYSIKYQIKNDTLSIIFAGELEGEKDSVLFTRPIGKSDKIYNLQSAINIDSLFSWYKNPCIADGDVKVFRIIKENKYKKVQVDNYYHPKIGRIVFEINSLIPEDYKIHYDSLSLTKSLINCGSIKVTNDQDETEEIEVRKIENTIRNEQGLNQRE